MKNKLFAVQPRHCRRALKIPLDNPIQWAPVVRRVFMFNPSSLYRRINKAGLLDPYKRQHTVSISFLFKNTNNNCACGCNRKLTGKQKRWATKACNDFAFTVFSIISGYTRILRQYRSLFIGGYRCEVCQINDSSIVYELDHIYPIKFGGGGGWLSNYEFKCKQCHREKTNKDFGLNQK